MVDSSLLLTKMRIPPAPQRTMARARLRDALEQEVPHHQLTVVVAPAGYGKTTLLANWARSSRFSIAWLSLGEDDDDLDRFLRYLLAAWAEVQPDVQTSPLGLLLAGRLPERDGVLPAFINAGLEAPDPVIFVLDDYHLIEEPSIHETLAFLLDHLPPALHFVLAGRAEPPLPLARYRARQQLVELRADDLRFSQEETVDFLSHLAELDLTLDEVARLYTQTEGWIAGLQLVALTLRHRRDLDRHRLVVSGRHRFIADYLAQDVLDRLPVDQRDFLLKTSILEGLHGPLCEAVIEGAGGQEMLEQLERKNLFLLPLDDNRQWYRYHRLFADFLQEELQRRYSDEIVPLHQRAAAWYLVHKLPERAFHHAVAGQDAECVVQIFDDYVNAKLLRGEFKIVKRWLDAIPAAWMTAHPVLELARAGLLAYTGELEACVRCVNDVEQRLARVESADAPKQLARVTAVRCFIACTQNDLERAEAFAEQGLRNLPEDDFGFRPGIFAALGDTYRRHARWEEARECYLKLLDFAHAPFFRVQAVHVYGALADLSLRQGRLQEAAGYWKKAVVAIQDQANWGSQPLPLIGWVYIRMGELHYEWNELGEAWDYLSQGLEHAELGGDVRALIAGYLLATRLKLTDGCVETAAAFLEQARPLVEQASFADWRSRFQRCQLELWLAQDRLRTAVTWADEMLRDASLEERPESEIAQLAVARVLIVKGDEPAVRQALELLERLLQAAEAEGRMGAQIEALALQALAHWKRGERTDALTSLGHALRLAEPEGYVRLFTDLGIPMGRLLQEARSRAVLPDYVETLLAAFASDLSLPLPAQEALPDPLTPREQEVLQLLAAGLTDREIGEALVISHQTVKKHTGNIYSKLGVRSRTEAAVRARELNLLD